MSEKLFTAVSGSGSGVYKRKKEQFTATYYKKKEMDDLYPAGGFAVVGQVGKGMTEIGTVIGGEGQLTVYAPSKMPHAKIVGYIEVGKDEYLSIVKDVLLLWLLWILLAAALIAALAFLLKTVVPTMGGGETTTKPQGVIDDNAVLGPGDLSVPDKIETENRDITVNGIAKMNLKAGVREQNFVFSNPAENPCYFVLEVVLVDSGEVIYTSNLLPPGYSISQFELNRPLAAGSYRAVVHVKTYSFDKEQRPLNNVDLKTTIVVSE